MHQGKVDPGVSKLPQGNELSRDHVNRPLWTLQRMSMVIGNFCLTESPLTLLIPVKRDLTDQLSEREG